MSDKVQTIDSARTIEQPAWLMAMFATVKLRSEFTSPDDLVFCTRAPASPTDEGTYSREGCTPRWPAPACRARRSTRCTRTHRSGSRTAATTSRCRSASDIPRRR